VRELFSSAGWLVASVEPGTELAIVARYSRPLRENTAYGFASPSDEAIADISSLGAIFSYWGDDQIETVPLPDYAKLNVTVHGHSALKMLRPGAAKPMELLRSAGKRKYRGGDAVDPVIDGQTLLVIEPVAIDVPLTITFDPSSQ
jgi:hypothetical protein